MTPQTVDAVMRLVVEYGMTVGTCYVFAERGNVRGEERTDADAKAQLTELSTALTAAMAEWRPIGSNDRRIQGLIVGHWHAKASAWVDVCQAYWQDDAWHNADTHMPIMYAPTHCMTPTPPPGATT